MLVGLNNVICLNLLVMNWLERYLLIRRARCVVLVGLNNVTCLNLLVMNWLERYLLIRRAKSRVRAPLVVCCAGGFK